MGLVNQRLVAIAAVVWKVLAWRDCRVALRPLLAPERAHRVERGGTVLSKCRVARCRFFGLCGAGMECDGIGRCEGNDHRRT